MVRIRNNPPGETSIMISFSQASHPTVYTISQNRTTNFGPKHSAYQLLGAILHLNHHIDQSIPKIFICLLYSRLFYFCLLLLNAST